MQLDSKKLAAELQRLHSERKALFDRHAVLQGELERTDARLNAVMGMLEALQGIAALQLDDGLPSVAPSPTQ